MTERNDATIIKAVDRAKLRSRNRFFCQECPYFLDSGCVPLHWHRRQKGNFVHLSLIAERCLNIASFALAGRGEGSFRQDGLLRRPHGRRRRRQVDPVGHRPARVVGLPPRPLRPVAGAITRKTILEGSLSTSRSVPREWLISFDQVPKDLQIVDDRPTKSLNLTLEPNIEAQVFFTCVCLC